jgi:hypothetical protein
MGEAPRALTVGDVNDDGHADLIVASLKEPSGSTGALEPEQILVRLGKGDGTFGELVRSPGPYLPEHVLTADIDGDSKLDVVSTLFYGGAAAFLGDGEGAFNVGPSASGCERSPGAAAGDFNADGLTDVALLCREEGTVYLKVLFGSASGQFEVGAPYNLMPEHRFNPRAVAAGDMNGDSMADLVIVGAHDGQPSAIVHLNDGAGQFEALEAVPAGDEAVELADVDGDGNLDAVTAGASLVLLSGNGDGTFAQPETVFAEEALSDIAVSDLDGDGRIDFAATAASGLNLFLAGEDGQYARRTLPGGTNPSDVAIADFNGNGESDVVFLNQSSPGSITLYFDRSLR